MLSLNHRLQKADHQSLVSTVSRWLGWRLTIWICGASLLGTATSAQAIVEIRVAIEDKASALTIGASTTAVVTNSQGQKLGQLAAMQIIRATADGQGVRLGPWRSAGWLWISPAQGGGIYIAERGYRGRLLLVPQGNSLLAVNYVDLEQYLYSVVGSEMPASWPFEALKAQAVAARSYGLAHRFRPASRWYDLGDTERWQVYKGVASEGRTTYAAVNATRGQVLTFGNGLVEAMYAASDEIIREVFGGIGMSQTGAYDLARQGFDYRQILSSYYPGAGLARIQAR
jgi:peptidoglycan hydrolase-like amidase